MKLKPASFIELDSIKDLARLACALEKAPLPVFSMQLEGEDILAVQVDLLMGRPIIYYAKTSYSGEFLAYRKVGSVEDVVLVNSITNPALVYAPIIQVEKIPTNMMKYAKVHKNSNYLSIKLKELASLAKVSSYKMIYEEPPLPLFLFKNDYLVLGTFMDINESSDTAFFYYVDMDSTPDHPFLKYSAQKGEKPAFTSNVDVHGYVYMKVIKLKKDHPLVKIDE
ncbi:MAG: hypothetical protein ACE5KA_00800 [Nitrososphaerales archaeon]